MFKFTVQIVVVVIIITAIMAAFGTWLSVQELALVILGGFYQCYLEYHHDPEKVIKFDKSIWIAFPTMVIGFIITAAGVETSIQFCGPLCGA